MLAIRAAPVNLAQIRRVGAVRTCSLPRPDRQSKGAFSLSALVRQILDAVEILRAAG